MTTSAGRRHPEPPPDPVDKAAWRRWARSLAPVPPATARSVVGHLDRFLDDVRRPVVAYLALPDEVDIVGVTGEGDGRMVALPRLDEGGGLTIHVDDGRREAHPHGIRQPPADAPSLAPDSVGAVLVPGRVFDRDGYRLGRGGGHYDRFLRDVPPGVPVVGVTCVARIVDRLPREAHDVAMTHLATETGVAGTGRLR